MCILECVFVCVLADAYSSNIVIASSLRKGVYDSWAFYLHAVLLWQAFARCRKFPTTASHRSLGHVSIPMWLIVLSNQLLIIALVSHCLTNQLELVQHVVIEKKMHFAIREGGHTVGAGVVFGLFHYIKDRWNNTNILNGSRKKMAYSFFFIFYLFVFILKCV